MNTNKDITSKPLLWIGLAGITMFFAGITSAVLVSVPKIEVPYAIPNWFLYSTLVIILSSLLLIIANRKAKNNKSSFLYVLSAFVLGLLFTVFQFEGWAELIENNIHFAGNETEESYFYVLSGSHLAHLFGGLISLLVVSVKSKKNKYNAEDSIGLQISSTYWHYLGILWVYLYVFSLWKFSDIFA